MSGEMHPHPEYIYYHTAMDCLGSAKVEKDPFKRKQFVSTSLVFSVLCLETYINQLYWKFSETRKIIKANDNFPLQSKWLMLPLLLGGDKTYEINEAPYQDFNDLVKIRNNRLVHFKPDKERRTSNKNYKDDYILNLLADIEVCEKYFRCIEGMIASLNELSNNRSGLPEFLKGKKMAGTVWASFTL